MKVTRVLLRPGPLLFAALVLFCSRSAWAGLAPGVRGLATRAPGEMKIDGDLSEFKEAFCTPVEYFSFEPIGKVVFRVLGLDGSNLGDYEGKIETFEADGSFRRAVAQWPNELSPPGAYHLLGLVYDRSGKELARVAPRMVSVNMQPGY